MCEPDQTSHRLGENGWEGGKLHGRERTTNFYWTVKKEMNNCFAVLHLKQFLRKIHSTSSTRYKRHVLNGLGHMTGVLYSLLRRLYLNILA